MLHLEQENLFSMVNISQDRINLLVVKSVKTSPDIDIFREKIIREVLLLCKRNEETWGKIFSQINKLDLGHYLGFKSEFRSVILLETKKLNQFVSRKIPPENAIFKNFIGRIVCSNLGIPSNMKMGNYEIEEINKVISNIMQ